MVLTITLEPEIEARLRAEAERTGLTLDKLTSQRLLEAELLWRIRTIGPETETRQLHRLLRQRKSGVLTEAEQVRLQTLLDEREQWGAQRLHDLAQLSHLRSIPVRQLMEHLGIRPLVTP
ncbi:MAG: hypothetical protein JWN14_2744 [Chthonomonadales bacterium]|nr:hypothetical protein [Chthonomonadales bacterium]